MFVDSPEIREEQGNDPYDHYNRHRSSYQDWVGNAADGRVRPLHTAEFFQSLGSETIRPMSATASRKPIQSVSITRFHAEGYVDEKRA